MYQAAYIATNEWYPIENLDPKPEAFSVDHASFDIFAKLAKVAKIKPNAYREALRRTDALLRLEQVLTSEETPVVPVLEDSIRAQTYAQIASKSAHELLGAINNPTEHMEAKRHVADLDRFLEIHVGIVQKLCHKCI